MFKKNRGSQQQREFCFVKLPILQSSQVDLVPKIEIFDCIPSSVTTHPSSLWKGGCGSTQPRKAVKKIEQLKHLLLYSKCLGDSMPLVHGQCVSICNSQ